MSVEDLSTNFTRERLVYTCASSSEVFPRSVRYFAACLKVFMIKVLNVRIVVRYEGCWEERLAAVGARIVTFCRRRDNLF